MTVLKHTPDEDAARARLFQHAGQVIFATGPDGRVVEWNLAATALFGRRLADALGQLPGEATGAGAAWPDAETVSAVLAAGRAWTGDIAAVAADGGALALAVTAARLPKEPGAIEGIVWTAADVTGDRRRQDELGRLASTDDLTGLTNRRQFDLLLEMAVRLAIRRQMPGALVYVDVDDLKAINDSLGHAAGDAVLQAVAGVLRDNVRASDIVARVGGDEFSLILFDVDAADAVAKAGEMLEAIRNFDLNLDGPPPSVTASAGVAMFPEHSDDPAELASMADRAMYEAKTAGVAGAGLHEPGPRALRTPTRLGMTRGLVLDALEYDRLVLYRQPIVDLGTGEPAMYETLVRIRNADGSHRLPGDFIPDAERLDLVREIDRAVARMAMSRWRSHADAGSRLTLTVNVSARSLDPSFARFATAMAKQLSIPPEYFYFEITETAVSRSAAGAERCLRMLTDAGFGLMIDDFGAGATSFRQLRELPLRAVKLYGPLVRGIAAEPHSRDAVAALTSLAHTLHLGVVAEWVEDDAVAKLVAELGVDLGQGFHFGRPEEFPDPGAHA